MMRITSFWNAFNWHIHSVSSRFKSFCCVPTSVDQHYTALIGKALTGFAIFFWTMSDPKSLILSCSARRHRNRLLASKTHGLFAWICHNWDNTAAQKMSLASSLESAAAIDWYLLVWHHAILSLLKMCLSKRTTWLFGWDRHVYSHSRVGDLHDRVGINYRRTTWERLFWRNGKKLIRWLTQSLVCVRSQNKLFEYVSRGDKKSLQRRIYVLVLNSIKIALSVLTSGTQHVKI